MHKFKRHNASGDTSLSSPLLPSHQQEGPCDSRRVIEVVRLRELREGHQYSVVLKVISDEPIVGHQKQYGHEVEQASVVLAGRFFA